MLHNIYHKLFEADADSPWPLTVAVRQVETLRRVAKSWAQALADRPPALHLDIFHDEWCHAKWFSSFPVKTLHMNIPLGNDPDEEDNTLEPGPVLMTDGSVERLSFGKMNALESLAIDSWYPFWNNEPGIFNADPLEKLEHLSHIRLEGFRVYELKNLPLSVRNITLIYGG